MIRFMHIRRFDKAGKLLSTGGFTVAVVKQADDSTFNIRVAQCSKKDPFCRRIGRAVASGRLEVHGPHYMLNEKGLRMIVRKLCQRARSTFPDKSYNFLAGIPNGDSVRTD